MSELELTPEQKAIVLAPVGQPRSLFLHGPAGCGKTTTAVARLRYLLDIGVPGSQIVVWVLQRSLGRPYVSAVRSVTAPNGTPVDVLGLDGLARRLLDLYWPLVAESAGFDPTHPPVYLTLETAQYYLDQVIEPLLQGGAFGDVVLPRNRLLSQIIDNLNKAALVGFPHTEIAPRLIASWAGPSSRQRVFDAVQTAANDFRDLCHSKNLLDFSLQVETLIRFVLTREECRAPLRHSYRHIIADNLEEDIPVAHDLLRDWVAGADSALLVYDHDAGFRSYLGADPTGALKLAELCDQQVRRDSSYVSSAGVLDLAAGLVTAAPDAAAPAERGKGKWEDALAVDQWRFHTEMLVYVADEVERLLTEPHTPPEQVAIVAPFVDDALRFVLVRELERRRVPVRTHRPSRALREEPAVQCVLTLAQLAHPHWQLCPLPHEVALALTLAIEDLDLTRATLLVKMLYGQKDDQPQLREFGQLRTEAQERITFVLGERYSGLRTWLKEYALVPGQPLDVFLSLFFDEVLSRPGYGFHGALDAAAATANLIESVRKFRRAVDAADHDELGQRYIAMVRRGVVAAQYLNSPSASDKAVFVGPAHTFLAENRPVAYQFWLYVNSPAWGRRIYQPLTHPYVLTRHWPADRLWTDDEEQQTSDDALSRILLGLLRRCRERVYALSCDLNPRGREEHGPLADRLQRLLRLSRQSAEQ